jgi:hypothetical protein
MAELIGKSESPLQLAEAFWNEEQELKRKEKGEKGSVGMGERTR